MSRRGKFAQVGDAEDVTNYSVMLREFIDSTDYNHDKPDEAHRYSERIKYVCIYLYILSGKLCYETLALNFDIPAASTIGI